MIAEKAAQLILAGPVQIPNVGASLLANAVAHST